jgi:NAD(P)-dependent dehydrogenase (short-subunit alcohol dehydrogenase family)
MDLHLADKIAVVTGAASGVGATVARALCGEGVFTIFADIDREGGAQATKGLGDRAAFRRCDTSQVKDVEELFDFVMERCGALHILVNNAAISRAGYTPDIREEDFRKILDVNVRGYVHTTRRAIPLMKETGYGRLVFINSGSGLKASSGLPLYSASKYFERGFAISVALEVGRYNITANSICPSDIYPDMNPEDGTGAVLAAKSWADESLRRVSFEKEGVDTLGELIEKRVAKNPMRKSCTAEDVANLVLFLSSDRAGFINGQSIGVNGGGIPY